jgi:hypothetical protein
VASTLDGIPGMTETTKVFVQTVRLYLRDYAELNRLIAGEETNDRMIAWAVLDALSNFNGTPPITTFTLEDLFERQQKHLMLRLTVEAVIESVGLLQTRNHINYSTGGLNVGINDKTPLLMNWLQYFKSFTAQKMQQVKVAFNIESILGPSNVGIHSEYWAVNATYLSY